VPVDEVADRRNIDALFRTGAGHWNVDGLHQCWGNPIGDHNDGQPTVKSRIGAKE
jgi:hypothetical protein